MIELSVMLYKGNTVFFKKMRKSFKVVCYIGSKRWHRRYEYNCDLVAKIRIYEKPDYMSNVILNKMDGVLSTKDVLTWFIPKVLLSLPIYCISLLLCLNNPL
ncbi:hypothetical protein K501DRAFT_272532 [Backusella circina FSU 941]|nr:hypothetical protein K501DRAFT_272532 [Backusella circina FSU 941]